MAELTIRLVSASFVLGFQLAAPFLVFGFALYAALGILARLMPQLQVFFVAMPINIMFGFVLLALLLGSMMTLFLNFYSAQMAQFL
jgi:flagellar biosynthesis protein FliR